jgi:hypothetical protein
MNSIIGIQMKNKITIPFIILLLCLQSCKQEAKLPEIETIPVTVTTIDTTGIDDYEEVSGTVSYSQNPINPLSRVTSQLLL